MCSGRRHRGFRSRCSPCRAGRPTRHRRPRWNNGRRRGTARRGRARRASAGRRRRLESRRCSKADDYGSLGAYALSTSFNQAPIANGTITPTTVQYQGTLSYNASLSSDPDGTITAYNWNFGDGTTSTSASGTKAYSAPGSYTATLKVTDNKGATGGRLGDCSNGGGRRR